MHAKVNELAYHGWVEMQKTELMRLKGNPVLNQKFARNPDQNKSQKSDLENDSNPTQKSHGAETCSEVVLCNATCATQPHETSCIAQTEM
jgi:hypothetical protein